MGGGRTSICGDRQLSFRIGINSGPVVAGVIGRKKFIYDLWGEAVNLASRMESHGRVRCIQVTSNTHELIGDAFDCTSVGLIEVKGVGAMEVWHVIGRKRCGASNRSVKPVNQTASGELD
jgi:adenylate cyclase